MFIDMFKGKEYGDACSPVTPCKPNANLVCNTTCQCKQDYIEITIPGFNSPQCYSSGKYNAKT